jgi:hypothetical protein
MMWPPWLREAPRFSTIHANPRGNTRWPGFGEGGLAFLQGPLGGTELKPTKEAGYSTCGQIGRSYTASHSAILRISYFRSAVGRTGNLTTKAMNRIDAWRMIQRHAAELGTRARIGCHTFRATGITA